MPIVEARDLSKRFILRHNPSGSLKVHFLGLFHRSHQEQREEFWALRDVSLRIGRGESIGLIGRNGSGKSTLLKLIAAIHTPTSGQLLVERDARIGTMIELGVGFHPELTGAENVGLNAAIYGLSQQEIEILYPEIVKYSGLAHFMDVPLKNYSSGMHMRLGFAIAANLDPDLLLLDEVFAVGDIDFQQQCIRTLQTFQSQGKTIIFVSHSPDAIRAICRRVCVLDRGRLMYDGDVDNGLATYEHMMKAPAAAGPAPPRQIQTALDLTDEELDTAWHRTAIGGQWRASGEWQLDFLRRQGLRPNHYVLDVGCGSLSGARVMLPFMDQHCYWGYEKDRRLFEAGVKIELVRANVRPERGHLIVNDWFDLSESPHQFAFAIANGFWSRLSLNAIARCVPAVLKKLEPGGRFYATWVENRDPLNFEPLVHQAGATTYPDMEPFHYPFEVLAGVCGALGARVERVPDLTHPRGESVMLISRADDA
ncbi:MAG TPA: ATP-binding cassette domain-containing protein [Vicinamibacterales bacterium]|nr:ATP-binding cassette domain-containing protein [Vicinamibacterales bacterium]